MSFRKVPGGTEDLVVTERRYKLDEYGHRDEANFILDPQVVPKEGLSDILVRILSENEEVTKAYKSMSVGVELTVTLSRGILQRRLRGVKMLADLFLDHPYASYRAFAFIAQNHEVLRMIMQNAELKQFFADNQEERLFLSKLLQILL